MRKVLGRRDFVDSSRNVGQHNIWNSWSVCQSYRLEGDEIVAECPLPSLNWTSKTPKQTLADWHEARTSWRHYEPIRDVPDLFLKLAHLHDESHFDRAAVDFVHRYGVLGGSNSITSRGRERTGLAELKAAACRAWLILRLYESVINRDGYEAERLLYDFAADVLDAPLIRFEDMPKELRYFPDDPAAERCADAMYEVTKAVSESLQKFCKPVILPDHRKSILDTSAYKQGWEFTSLLGAAYLQAFWLITSGEEIRRCSYCRRIMATSRLQDNKRKRRSDRKYCNDSCRQAAHRAKKPKKL